MTRVAGESASGLGYISDRGQMEVKMVKGRSLRRHTALLFRSGGIVLLTLPVLASLASAPAAEPRRPNIVFIFSDDHAYQAIGAYGDNRRLVETPHIDRIAREG